MARLAFGLFVMAALLAGWGCGGDSKAGPGVASTAPVQSTSFPGSTATSTPTSAPATPTRAGASAAAVSPTAAAPTVQPTATTAAPGQTVASTATPAPVTAAPPTPTTAPALPASASVTVGGFANAFDPLTITIAAGGTVTWTWDLGVHDVTFDGFASETKSSGTFAHVFAVAGTYAYVCTVHQSTGMRGTVIVR